MTEPRQEPSYSMGPTRFNGQRLPPPAQPWTPPAPTMAPMRYHGAALAAYAAPEPEELSPGEAQLQEDMARLQQAYAAAGPYTDMEGHVRSYRGPEVLAHAQSTVEEAVKDSRFRAATGQPYIPREILAEPQRRHPRGASR